MNVQASMPNETGLPGISNSLSHRGAVVSVIAAWGIHETFAIRN